MRYELLGVASASAGVLSHLIYFIHGHKAMQAPRIFVFYLMSECLLWVRCFYLQGAFQGTLSATTISLSYFLGLFASIAVYRLFFHRLRRFPGPLAAKLTKFYGPYKARGGKSHINFVGLFEKYGDVVRIGKLPAHDWHRNEGADSYVFVVSSKWTHSVINGRSTESLWSWYPMLERKHCLWIRDLQRLPKFGGCDKSRGTPQETTNLGQSFFYKG